MNTYPTDRPTSEPTRGRRNDTTAGVTLVALGLIFLAGQFFGQGVWILPVIAVGFLGLGIARRNVGFMIPGGILGGISLGILLIESHVAQGKAEGGVFLLAFAVGWAVVYAASRLFSDRPQTWALIPGGIMALIGALVLLDAAGLAWPMLAFQGFGLIWPLILVAVGVYILVRGRRR
jgi:hypothetical protein